MIRVLVVEDSTTAALLIKGILESDPDIQVIALACDGPEGIGKAIALKPDIVTMDIHMPGMDGFDATTRIMTEAPCPVVIVSARVNPGEAAFSFKALEAGALCIVEKPVGPENPNFSLRADELIDTVKTMADVKVVGRRRSFLHRRVYPVFARRHPDKRFEVVAIGASTGGPAALARILRDLPEDFPVPILVVQHIAEGFHAGLTEWLGNLSRMSVKLAAQGQKLEAGSVYIAPSNRHLCVDPLGMIYLSGAVPIDGFRPSATMLFQSVAESFGSHALGIILTGMGSDGTAGLQAFRSSGGYVLAQDEDSCVVFGMPGSAVAAGAVDRIVPLAEMARTMLALTGRYPKEAT
jgi:two-component system chemotaxis response regulator CheB